MSINGGILDAETIKAWSESPDGQASLAEAINKANAEAKRLDDIQRIKPEHLTQRYR